MLPWFLPLVADDRVLASLQASRSFRRPPRNRGDLLPRVERSLLRGRSMAQSLPGKGIRCLLGAFHLTLRIEHGGFHHAGVIRHAEYRRVARTIVVYAESIAGLKDAYSLADSGGITADEILEVLVLHELYHHLDQMTSVGSRRRSAPHIDAEIAAHAFARTAAGFPFLPGGLDWLYLIARGRYSPEHLRSELLHTAGVLAAPASRREDSPSHRNGGQ